MHKIMYNSSYITSQKMNSNSIKNEIYFNAGADTDF